MSPLRIVLLMMEPPVPFGNAVGRWYYALLKGLVERGHNVTALATCSRLEEIATSKALFPAPQYDFRAYPHPHRSGFWAKWETVQRPYSYMYSPELKRDFFAALNQGFDVLHLEALWSGWLGLKYRRRAILNLHYLFQIDLENEPARSLNERALRWRTNTAERYLLRNYPNLCTLTPRLTQYVQQISPAARVHTVPLSMDLSFYPFENKPNSSESTVIGLIGSFHWNPSYSAGVRLLKRLWPAIKTKSPKAKLLIVGRGAHARLGQLVPPSPDIVIVDEVPDVLPYFRQMDMLLYAPSRGSGMKVKVLESFALGVPVVTTQEGVEGIPAEDGVHAGVAEDDAGLIERTVALLENPARRSRQRHAARRLLETHCDPHKAVSSFERIYLDVQGSSPHGSRMATVPQA